MHRQTALELRMTKGRTAVIIPALNEAEHIDGVLSFFRKEAPGEVAIIAVADGGSSDGTHAIVARHAAADARVRLIQNPDRLQSAGVNRVVADLPADIETLIRADAHARYPQGFVATLLAEQRLTGGAKRRQSVALEWQRMLPARRRGG